MKTGVFKFAALAAATAMILCACGNNNEKSDAGQEVSASEDYTIRIATMTTGFPLPMHHANKTGVFEELGLKVEEEFFDNGPTINEAIASGDIDIAGVGGMPAVSGAIANNSKVIAWMEDDESSVQIYARNDSDIVSAGKGSIDGYPDIYGSAETWKGKSVVCAMGTSSQYTLLAVLETMGLTQDDIELINMEGVSGAAAFVAGTGDLYVGFNPQWSECYNNPDEYTCVATCADTDKKLNTVLIASEEFCENHPDLVVKFLEGILKVQNDFYDDAKYYYESMYEWQNTFGECSEELAQYTVDLQVMRSLEERRKLFEEKDGSCEMQDTLLSIADFMVSNKVIEEESRQKIIDDKFVDSSYIFEAVESLSAE
ncbi:MAG: NrtA/SsuA/CpmA family ABC transporter substrate-binding protein [Eubacteriales bacterium]|nr:NrtA/SsuA/CpmA family ABC transporter substrate-binding protein [Eubacteriales bacterium]